MLRGSILQILPVLAVIWEDTASNSNILRLLFTADTFFAIKGSSFFGRWNTLILRVLGALRAGFKEAKTLIQFKFLNWIRFDSIRSEHTSLGPIGVHARIVLFFFINEIEITQHVTQRPADKHRRE